MARAKTFLFYTCAQALMYTLLVVNYRSIAKGWLPLALITDGIYALLSYTLIRHIAKDEKTKEAISGYIFGSLIGTTIGMLV